MHLINKLYPIALVLLLAGCFEKDIPVEPQPRLSNTVTIDAGANKQLVNYYSLEQNDILAQIDPMSWDIGYTDEKLFFNGFRSIQAAKFDAGWKDRTDTVGLSFDYLTVGYVENMWQLEADQSYVLDFGYDENYASLGLYKFAYTLSAGDVSVKFSKIEEVEYVETTFPEDDFHYSLLQKKYSVVPFVKEYDLVLGKYTDLLIFPNVQSDYLVYGVLLGNAEAKQLSTPFADINLSSLDTLEFDNPLKTAIGWDWKFYDLNSGAYSLKENRTFIIKTQDDFYYKLRFVDFYNQEGVSGHPTLEYTLL